MDEITGTLSSFDVFVDPIRDRALTLAVDAIAKGVCSGSAVELAEEFHRYLRDG